ncbi:MAG: alcohol dehydrogenase family protein [Marinibacterium sp.]|nr:alcohol dehydrogenase family protein [Marinibacterium sp.]
MSTPDTPIPDTMQAMVLTGHGDLDKLVFHRDWPTPQPGPNEVLIRVGACGLNNTDVNTRSGWYSKTVDAATTGAAYDAVGEDDPSWGGRPLSFPRIQGADAVGRVVALGPGAPEALMGQRVIVDGWQRDWSEPDNTSGVRYFGSEMDGGFAQYTKADHRGVAVVNSPLGDAELATFQCSYTTAEGMLVRADVGADDTVLVPGASGGVGGALVQLARRRGARVIAMASPAKHDAVAALGPDRILPRAPEDLRAALGDDAVTVVADVVGGPDWPRLIDVLERGGRYTCSGAIAGPVVPLDLRTLYLRDLTFTGSTVIARHVLRDVVGYIERGEITPVLAATYPLCDLHAAQSAFIDKRHTGNIVVIP